MGLLDAFFSDDPKQAAYNAMAMNLMGAQKLKGQRGSLLSALADGASAGQKAYVDSTERAFNDKLRREQFDALVEDGKFKREAAKQKVDEAARTQKLKEDWLGLSPQGSQAALVQGASLGDFGPTNTNAARIGAPQGGGLAAKYGIPSEAVEADFLFNGGKGLSGMVMKRGVPDMQVTGGYAYDKNKLGAGFMPSISTSSDGKTSMIVPGASGMPIVMAPQGAMQTYGAYKNIDEGTKANFDPLTITPQGQNPQMTTRGAFVRELDASRPQVAPMRPPNQRGPIVPSAGGLNPEAEAERMRMLQAELPAMEAQRQAALRVGDVQTATRLNLDIQGLKRDIARGPVKFGVPLQSEAEKVSSVESAKASVDADVKRSEDIKTAQTFLSRAQLARQALEKGPTSSGAGQLRDSALNFFGKSTSAAEAAKELEAHAAWLTANVPRMQGPQSDKDVLLYSQMAGQVGNSALPTPQRLAALRGIEELMKRTIAGPQSGGASGSFSPESSPSNSVRKYNPATGRIE